MAVGVGALGVGVHAIGIVAIFSYGVGLGLTIPTTNLYVAQANEATRASALSVLNLAWGLGAVGAPAVVALFQRTNSVRIFLFGLAAALMLMAAPIARLSEPDRSTHPSPASRRRTSGALLFGALLFLYVGTETSVAGWVALYAQRLDVIPAALSVAMPSLFWAALLAGRAAVPIVLQWVSEARLLVASLLVATAGVAALTGSRSAGVLAMSVVIGGLGLSTVFPLTLAQFTRDMERAAASTAGPVFVLAGFGGAVLPPLVGQVSAASGSLTAGLVVPLLGCVAMLAVLRVWRVRVAADIIA
jgi:fucose permease